MLVIIIAILCLCFMILSIYKRLFLEGIICGLLTISASIFALLQIVFKIAEKGERGEIAMLFTVYCIIPLIFIGFCIWLISNASVMRSGEGKSFTAKLSLLIGLNLIIVVPGFFYLVFSYVPFPTWIIFLLTTFCLMDIFFTFVFIAYLFYSFLNQIIPVRKTIHYIIILGAGIREEEITPLLRSRLDKAIAYQEKQREKITFIVTGGQGSDESVSEAFAMRQYLLHAGILNEQIIMEEKSTSTLENMLFSKEKIMEDWSGEKPPVILFSTSNYHVLRGVMCARRVGMKAEGIGAPVAFYLLPSAFIREFVALLVHYKWLTIGTIIFIVALVLATYLPIGLILE